MPSRAVVLVFAAVGCTRADGRPPPPPPTVRLIDAPPPIDAAPPIDAQVTPNHPHLHVRDFSDSAYYGSAAIETPGMPAYDPATRAIAVAYDDQDGLGTEPNVLVQLRDPRDARLRSTIAVWTQAQSRAFVAGAEPTPEKLRDLERAIDVAIVAAEEKLAPFVPMTACVADEDVPQADPKGETFLPYCPGQAAWHCDDATITYHRDGDGNPRPTLAITAHGKTTTVDTRSWRKPAVQIYSGHDPVMKVATVNCIYAAHRIPNSRDVLLELEHSCNTSGDWCWAGGPTWQVVHLP